MHMYRHIVDGRKLDLPIGKVVCLAGTTRLMQES